MWIFFAVVVLLLLLLLYWILRNLPFLLKGADYVLQPLTAGRGSPDNAVVVFFVFMIYSLTILPGRLVWTVCMGYSFGWSSVLFLTGAHVIGSVIVFLIGTRTRNWYCPRRCQMCCARAVNMSDWILALERIIERSPFRSIIMVNFASPNVAPLIVLLLGRYLKNVRVQSTVLPMLSGILKSVRDVYVGTRIKDLSAYLDGKESESPLVNIVFILSILLAIAVAALLGYLARRQLKLMQESGELGAGGPDAEETLPEPVMLGAPAGSDCKAPEPGSEQHALELRPYSEANTSGFSILDTVIMVSFCMVAVILGLGVAVRGIVAASALQSPLYSSPTFQFGQPNIASVSSTSGTTWLVRVPLRVQNPNVADLSYEESTRSATLRSPSCSSGLSSWFIAGGVIPGRGESELFFEASLPIDCFSSQLGELDMISRPSIKGTYAVSGLGLLYRYDFEASFYFRVVNATNKQALTASCGQRQAQALSATSPCSSFGPSLQELLVPVREWDAHKDVCITLLVIAGFVMAFLGLAIVAATLKEEFQKERKEPVLSTSAGQPSASPEIKMTASPIPDEKTLSASV